MVMGRYSAGTVQAGKGQKGAGSVPLGRGEWRSVRSVNAVVARKQLEELLSGVARVSCCGTRIATAVVHVPGIAEMPW